MCRIKAGSPKRYELSCQAPWITDKEKYNVRLNPQIRRHVTLSEKEGDLPTENMTEITLSEVFGIFKALLNQTKKWSLCESQK